MGIEPGRLVHSPVSVPDVRALGVNTAAANAGIDLRTRALANEPTAPPFSPITPPPPAPPPRHAPAAKSRKRKATEVVAPRQKKPRVVKKEDVNYKF